MNTRNPLASILQPLRQSDWLLHLAVGLLLILGVLFVYSSCYISDEVPVRSLYKRQILWAVIGGRSREVLVQQLRLLHQGRKAGKAYQGGSKGCPKSAL